MKDLILISTPYSHVDPEVKKRRIRETSTACAWFMNNDFMVFSPITYGCAIIENGDIKLPDSNTFWKEYCDTFVAHSKQVFVLNMEGWDISSGVKAEIEAAKLHSIPVHLVQIDYEKNALQFLKEL